MACRPVASKASTRIGSGPSTPRIANGSKQRLLRRSKRVSHWTQSSESSVPTAKFDRSPHAAAFFSTSKARPMRMVGINIDITQRKEAEEELQRSEERYRTFIRQSSEGIWCCEMTQPIPTGKPEDEQIEDMYRFGYLGECNDAMAQMYGFTSAVGHRRCSAR